MRNYLGIALAVFLVGCFSSSAAWQRVSVQHDARSIRNPATELRALARMNNKMTTAAAGDQSFIFYDGWLPKEYFWRQIGDFQILAREGEEKYRVVGYDMNGEEVFSWAPKEEDFDTSKRMYDTLYALWNHGAGGHLSVSSVPVHLRDRK